MRRPSRVMLSPEEARDQRRRYDSLNLDSSTDSADFSLAQTAYNNHVPSELLEEGEELYLHFFHERLRESGLERFGDEARYVAANLGTLLAHTFNF